MQGKFHAKITQACKTDENDYLIAILNATESSAMAQCRALIMKICQQSSCLIETV